MLTAWRNTWSVLAMAAFATVCAPLAARASIPRHSPDAAAVAILATPDPAEWVGKWLIRDPLGEAGGLNLTAFCENDPINKVDPLGLFGSSCNSISGNSEHYQLIGDGYYVPGGFTRLENNSLLGGGLHEGAQILANPRVQGGLRIIFGTIEIFGGAGYILGSGGLGTVVGGGWLVFDGFDQVGAGGYALFNGETRHSIRETVVYWGVDRAGGKLIVGATINFIIDFGAGACAARGCGLFREYRSSCYTPPNAAIIQGSGVPDQGLLFRMGRFEPQTGRVIFDDVGHFGRGAKGLNLVQKGDRIFWSNDSVSTYKFPLTADEVRSVDAALRARFPKADVIQLEGIDEAHSL